MRVITGEEMDRARRGLEATPFAKIQELMDRLTRDQPYVQVYLLGAGGDSLNDEERASMHFLGTVIWRAFDEAGESLPRVTDAELEHAENANMAMLDYLEGESPVSFEKIVSDVVAGYHQSEVMSWVVCGLMEPGESDLGFREDQAGLVFIYLKTLIDCLDRTAGGDAPTQP